VTYAKVEANRMNIKINELMALSQITMTEYQNFLKDLKSKLEIIENQSS